MFMVKNGPYPACSSAKGPLGFIIRQELSQS